GFPPRGFMGLWALPRPQKTRGGHMLRKLRPRLTYANVVATLALFLAVGGGTAFAVVAANQVNSASIIDGQVKARDIANKSIGPFKIKDAGVANANLGPGSVNSGKVADNSLTGVDINESTFDQAVPNSANSANSAQ